MTNPIETPEAPPSKRLIKKSSSSISIGMQRHPNSFLQNDKARLKVAQDEISTFLEKAGTSEKIRAMVEAKLSTDLSLKNQSWGESFQQIKAYALEIIKDVLIKDLVSTFDPSDMPSCLKEIINAVGFYSTNSTMFSIPGSYYRACIHWADKYCDRNIKPPAEIPATIPPLVSGDRKQAPQTMTFFKKAASTEVLPSMGSNSASESKSKSM